MSDANLWNFMCNCVLKFYFQIGSCMCAKHPRLIRLFLLFKVLKFARGEQMLCVCAVRARASKHLELIFCQWHLTSRPHANVGISVKQRMLLNSPIGYICFGWSKSVPRLCIFALHCTLNIQSCTYDTKDDLPFAFSMQS